MLGANNTVGTMLFGTLAGGAGASLTGGNFWQGAVTGLVVSGLNHVAHQEDPPGKKNSGFKNKLLKTANTIKNEYNANKLALRQGFDRLEIIGGTAEIVGGVTALFTEGAGLSIAVEGAKLSMIGHVGNSAMDVFDGNIDSLITRNIKFGISFGMGKAINSGVPYQSLKNYINAFKAYTETYIKPVLEKQWDLQNK